MNPKTYHPVIYRPTESLRHSQPYTYTTTKGDTLQDLLTRFSLTPEVILLLNADLELAPQQVIHLN